MSVATPSTWNDGPTLSNRIPGATKTYCRISRKVKHTRCHSTQTRLVTIRHTHKSYPQKRISSKVKHTHCRSTQTRLVTIRHTHKSYPQKRISSKVKHTHCRSTQTRLVTSRHCSHATVALTARFKSVANKHQRHKL